MVDNNNWNYSSLNSFRINQKFLIMSTQQFLKGLLMTLVAIFVTAWTNPPIQWVMVGISAATACLTYTGKNLLPWFQFLHSDSPAGTLSLINILSGLFVVLGAGLLDGLGQYLIEGVIVWSVLWKVVVSITLTYIVSTWFAPPYTSKKVQLFVVKGKKLAA